MTGAEIAWKTLRRERVNEPCIIGAWIMKREFFSRYSGIQDIYRDPIRTSVEAAANAGCNLNPQFIMPSPVTEHLAVDPLKLTIKGGQSTEKLKQDMQDRSTLAPEDVRDEIEKILEIDAVDGDFDVDESAKKCAETLLHLRSLSRDRTLFTARLGIPKFMSGYKKWTYDSYLSALLLYPEHLKGYYRYQAEKARLVNQTVVRAVEEYDITPTVYGGDDICFNDGPICSISTLDELYFPALEYAVQPLVDAGIDIVWHCDGNVLPIVERLISIGITGFQGFQEREARIPLEKMTEFRRKDGGKLIFFGSISVVHTFPHGSPEDVKIEIERCFQAAAPGGGFCLAPSSSILPETPIENISTFFEYGREYGRRFLGNGG